MPFLSLEIHHCYSVYSFEKSNSKDSSVVDSVDKQTVQDHDILRLITGSRRRPICADFCDFRIGLDMSRLSWTSKPRHAATKYLLNTNLFCFKGESAVQSQSATKRNKKNLTDTIVKLELD